MKGMAGMLSALFLCACGGEEIQWTEDVKLHDGKVVQLKRRTELSASGFPVSGRGFHQYHELCYAPLGVYWRSKPEYPPETFELNDGKAYVKVPLMSFDLCGLHAYPKDGALYFVWSGSDWERIEAGEFPKGSRLNLLQDPAGTTQADGVRGTVAQAEKEKRDASLYYTLKVVAANGLNEMPPYKGMCTRHPVHKAVIAPPPTSVFLGSQRKKCD